MASKTTRVLLMTFWGLAVCILVIIAAILLREFLSEEREFTYAKLYHQTEKIKETQTVTLFFGSTDGQGLMGEQREIPQRERLLDQIREVIEQLIYGPLSVLVRTIPPETKVNSIYLLPDDTLVLDFSRALQTLHTGGTTGEILTVYSIVNTLTTSFGEVESIQILIDGDEVDTLAGHLDLAQPFTRDSRWIKVSHATGA